MHKHFTHTGGRGDKDFSHLGRDKHLMLNNVAAKMMVMLV